MNRIIVHKSMPIILIILIGMLPVSGAADVTQFTVQTIDGRDQSLAIYRGQTLLIVNVASQCGLTPQYKELQALYEKYRERGFTILAFPANNFRNQEPGSNLEIQEFCRSNYGVTFPLFAKISVAGEDIHPLYALLTNTERFPQSGGPIRWNFDKFLISFDGQSIKRFSPKTSPLSEELTAALEAMLRPQTIKPPCCR